MPKNINSQPPSKSLKSKTKLIKTQIQCYINGTSSKDLFEIRSHCQQLIKHIAIPRRQSTQLHNWLHQQLLLYQQSNPKCKNQQQQHDQSLRDKDKDKNKNKNKNKWKRNKLRKKRKKRIYLDNIQVKKSNNKKPKQRYVYNISQQQQRINKHLTNTQISSHDASQQNQIPSSPHKPSPPPLEQLPPHTNHQPPPITPTTQTNNNMALPVIDDIDIAIANADNDNAIASSHTLIIHSNNIIFFNAPFKNLDLTMVNYQLFYYWIDAVISYSVADIPHVKDTPISDKLSNFGIIHQIKINTSKYINPAFRINVFLNNTIHDNNNNVENRIYLNVLNKKWFFYPPHKTSWIQDIEYNSVIKIAMIILTSYQLHNLHTFNVLFAIRSLNLPFQQDTNNQIYDFDSINKRKSFNLKSHQWRCNFINQLIQCSNKIIKNNYWLCVILTQYTLIDIYNMTTSDTYILINQCNISLSNHHNTLPYQIAVLLFIKRYLKMKNVSPKTTLDEIFKAQQKVNSNKIEKDQLQFNQAFSNIRQKINYNQPNLKSNNISQKLGFNPAKIPNRQPLNTSDKYLIEQLQNILPPLRPTNLALGYTPSKLETSVCSLGPKFIPTPSIDSINFYEIHNGVTKLLNQIKYKLKISYDYIIALNGIPCSIFKDKMPFVQQKHKKHNPVYKCTKQLDYPTLQNKLDELKHLIFITKQFLTKTDNYNNLTKAQKKMLSILETQTIIALVKQDKGSEFVREWMQFIIPKIQQIIKKCNLIPITIENVDWLIPNSISKTRELLFQLQQLGPQAFLHQKTIEYKNKDKDIHTNNPIFKPQLVTNQNIDSIDISASLPYHTITKFNTSKQLKYSNLRQYVLNKQNNLISQWIHTYINYIPECWKFLLIQSVNDKNNPGKISALVKDQKPTKKTRMIQAIIGQPKEYLGAMIQLYSQKAHQKYNPHTIKDSQTVCRMIDQLNKKYGRNTKFWDKQHCMSDDIVGFYPSLTHVHIYNNFSTILDRWETDTALEYPKIVAKYTQFKIIVTKIKNELHIIPTQAIKDALAIILKCHTTEFQQQLYIQTSGTPEGGKASPDFSMISAKPFDDRINELMGDRLICSGRYIDDGLRIGNFNYETVKWLINEINKIDKNVQFTFEFGDWGGKRIHFLDLYIIITPVGIITEMYYKPTQLFSYLSVKSAHPIITWLSVIKGIATNIRSHCNNGTINIHSRIQVALLYRQGYNYSQLVSEFNKIMTQSQNDILYKHTNYYNPDFLDKGYFYDNYEIFDSLSAQKELIQADSIELYKITSDMYKLRKNDPRIVNLVVPYHPQMKQLRKQLKAWHESLLSINPKLAALFPMGCFRLVQKRLPNLKERLAPSYSKRNKTKYYGNISCIINNPLFNMKCNICNKNILNKYKICNIHHKSNSDKNPINLISDKCSKHNTQTKWDKLMHDRNLTSTKPNKHNIFQNTKLSQKQIENNQLVHFSNNTKYLLSQYYQMTKNDNNKIYNRMKKYSAPSIEIVMQSYKLSVPQIKSLMSLRVEISNWINRKGQLGYKILIPNNPWLQLPHLNTQINWNDFYNFIEKHLIQYKIDNNIRNQQDPNKLIIHRYRTKLIFHNWGSLYHFQQNSNKTIKNSDFNQFFETKFLTYKITKIGWIKKQKLLKYDNLIVINYKPYHYVEVIDKSIKINQNIICHTPNVIYKSTLDLTPINGPIKQYVGSTRNTMISRATATNNDIRNGTFGNGMANFCIHYCNQNKIN